VAQQPSIDVGTIITVFLVIYATFAGDKNARVGFRPSNTNVWIFFIVLEESIKMGLMLFNQISFQGQRFCFRVGDDKFNFRHLSHHQSNAGTEGLTGTKIGTDSRPEFFGFTNVENFAILVAQEVHSRFEGNFPKTIF
jgi:hypothetical protein